eukprot:TRINITY_DN65_c0_g1_i1.p1 TRINITY_DN65_c0_g1~~TRINITY_DN65_c0_g1_i1.p1  ORF type:complete len:618 (-),score=21.71 TRINITY_DN65_c0_g1_i1:22-1803(-)
MQRIVFHWFTVDIRALGAFRIALAGVMLLDLYWRSFYFTDHYTEKGLFNMQELLNSQIDNPEAFCHWTLHRYTEWHVMVLYALHVVFAVLLLFGWKTRISTIGCWFLLCSLQTRNWVILEGADALLRITLFWAIFLPVGDRLVLPVPRALAAWKMLLMSARRRKKYKMNACATACCTSMQSPQNTNPTTRYFGGGVFGLYVQLATVYMIAGATKTGFQWRETGSAVWMVAELDLFVRPFGSWLLHAIPISMTRLLSFTTIYVEEYVIPICIFLLIPSSRKWTAIIRMVGFTCIFGLHLFFELCLSIGWFPFIGMASALPLIPTEAIDYLLSKIKRSKQAKLEDSPPLSSFDHSSSSLDTYEAEKPHNTHPPTATPLTHAPPTGQTPSPPATPLLTAKTDSFVWSYISVVSIAYIIAWLVGILPEPATCVAGVLRIDQDWRLFAPHPWSDDGWFVVKGEISHYNYTKTDMDTKEIDMLPFLYYGQTDAPVVETKPECVSCLWPTSRWQKYMTNLWIETKRRVQFLDWVCRKWTDADTGWKLEKIEMVFWLEATPYDPLDERQSVVRFRMAEKQCTPQLRTVSAGKYRHSRKLEQ